MAHKKGQGSSRNGRDSAGQRRGVKKYGGQTMRDLLEEAALERVLEADPDTFMFGGGAEA